MGRNSINEIQYFDILDFRYDTESLFGRKIFTNECGFEKQLKTCEACSCPDLMSFNITSPIRNNFLS